MLSHNSPTTVLPLCSPTKVPPQFSHENKNIKNILGGMWDASHLAKILCALRHWKRVSMPPITQYLRHPLPRANHIPPRTKTTRLTAKNPAHPLFGEFNPIRSLGLARPNRRFGLKHVHHILFKIQIVTLALVFYRSKIVKNTDLNFRKAHIVPQLLTMLWSKSGNSLTFNYHIISY